MPDDDSMTPEEIVSHEELFVDRIPAGLPDYASRAMEKGIRKSIAGIREDDPQRAAEGVTQVVAVVRDFPNTGAPGTNLKAADWIGCGDGCVSYLSGGGAVYATCYWSCIAGKALG